MAKLCPGKDYGSIPKNPGKDSHRLPWASRLSPITHLHLIFKEAAVIKMTGGGSFPADFARSFFKIIPGSTNPWGSGAVDNPGPHSWSFQGFLEIKISWINKNLKFTRASGSFPSVGFIQRSFGRGKRREQGSLFVPCLQPGNTKLFLQICRKFGKVWFISASIFVSIKRLHKLPMAFSICFRRVWKTFPIPAWSSLSWSLEVLPRTAKFCSLIWPHTLHTNY